DGCGLGSRNARRAARHRTGHRDGMAGRWSGQVDGRIGRAWLARVGAVGYLLAAHWPKDHELSRSTVEFTDYASYAFRATHREYREFPGVRTNLLRSS